MKTLCSLSLKKKKKKKEVLDWSVFVLDHRVFVLDQWVFGVCFWVFVFDISVPVSLSLFGAFSLSKMSENVKAKRNYLTLNRS